MRKLYSLAFILFICGQNVIGQEIISSEKQKRTKGSFYLTWGYNKDWFSKSDIHFKNTGSNPYDFTIHDVKAKDRPEFGEVFNKDISIPQFIYRLGYYFKNGKIGIEGGFDHAKYIVVQDQSVRITGNYKGEEWDKDTVLSTKVIRFEHTNGANFIMLSLVWRDKLLESKSHKHTVHAVVKPGLGLVVPQSTVYIFGKPQDNNYHIAGYIFGVEADLRYDLGKHFFFETGFKGVWANYTDVLAVEETKANHSFFAAQWIIGIGLRFAI